ncbi:phage tail tape measure protein, partial [Jatrophihabitans sp.]|uniref:phage tail tape measure protein n=1 Tax=Jatrophihabitans sp. TaxID=1932789 RepID=UPI0030C72D09|nr:hypothetical protein [Jatrophihabitans sp.]
MSRSVTVSLRALNTQFDQAYTTSATKAKGLGTAVEASTKKSDKAMKDLGRSSLVVGAGLTAAFVGATRSAMDFDAKMSQVQTLSHATASTMQDLRKAALDYGQAIGFSASQTADAEIELVKAGISVKDILGGGLTGALTLAAAGQIDVAQATEIAASAMTQFKLTGQDVPHIADLLAAGADKALGSVGDLGTALSSSGTVAAQFGWNLEETVGTLSEFAQNAQIGEKGGTLLRQMLLQLAAPSVKAKDLMDKYGLSLYDANGHMVSSSVLAGRLQTSFGGLSESARNFALGQIFGAHAIQGANILMKDGAAVNANWVKSVDDSGFAAQQAAGKMDNLKGDLTKLGAAFKRDIIEGGSQTNGVLRDGAKAATFALNAYADLPAPLQAGATATVGLSGATLVLGGAALAMIPKLKAANATILELTNGSMGLKGALGRAALGTAAITVAITELEAQLSGYRQGARDADQITEKLLARKDINTTKGLQDAANQLEAFSDKELKVAGKGNVLQTSWALVSGGFLRGNKALSDTANTFDQVVAKGDAMNRNLLDMSAATGLSTQKLQALADAAGVDLSGNITDVTTKVVGYYNSAVKGSPATQNLT